MPRGRHEPKGTGFNPIAALAGADVLVTSSPDVEEFHWSAEYQVIVLGHDLGATERRCALAKAMACRELGYDKWVSVPRYRKVMALAAVWLIPLGDLRDAMEDLCDMPDLAARLNVTVEVLAIRMWLGL